VDLSITALWRSSFRCSWLVLIGSRTISILAIQFYSMFICLFLKSRPRSYLVLYLKSLKMIPRKLSRNYYFLLYLFAAAPDCPSWWEKNHTFCIRILLAGNSGLLYVWISGSINNNFYFREQINKMRFLS